VSKNSAITLQSIFGDATLIHPLAQTLVANELRDPNRLVNGSVLLVIARKFVLVDQHIPASSSFLVGV
jgi:hypothetical protein